MSASPPNLQPVQRRASVALDQPMNQPETNQPENGVIIMNANDITKIEEVFTRHTAYDTRHVLNLKNEAVPEELLREIEKGCRSEKPTHS